MNNNSLLGGLLKWSEQWNYAALYSSNNIPDLNGEYDWLFAVGNESFVISSENNLADLDKWIEDHNNHYRFGVLSYDLRNRFEELNNKNRGYLDLPEAAFFSAEAIVFSKKGKLSFQNTSLNELSSFITQPLEAQFTSLEFRDGMPFNKYKKSFHEVKKLIQHGDLYEMNLCRPFYAEFNDSDVSPEELFLHLQTENPAVQSSFFKFDNYRILSTSPERFLRKNGTQLISEPIKGTTARYSDPLKDAQVKESLRSSLKERSENVMIVDLVRNDLSRICSPGSVQVKELFEIRTLPHVHQMVSVVTGQMEGKKSFEEILRATFPMGSMTGAPKVSAMNAADELETFRRTWYSGSIGYIAPNDDFDFNVLIRTLFLDVDNKRAMIAAGGAITSKSELDLEFEETELKANSVIAAIKGSVIRPTSK